MDDVEGVDDISRKNDCSKSSSRWEHDPCPLADLQQILHMADSTSRSIPRYQFDCNIKQTGLSYCPQMRPNTRRKIDTRNVPVRGSKLHPNCSPKTRHAQGVGISYCGPEKTACPKNAKQTSTALLMQGVTGTCGGIGTVLLVLEVVCSASPLDQAFHFCCCITHFRWGQSTSYNVAHPACGHKGYLPISTRFTPSSTDRDAGTALLHTP